MATQLSVYQGALRLLGPHELATLTDDRPERYQLDNAWTDAVAYMLLQGLWNFAIRTITVTESGTPIAGWDYAFTKPSDYVRTVGISWEPTFREGFEDYQDEGGKWYANVDTLYVRHVSNHATLGGLLLSAWPVDFTKALEAYLAFETGLPVSGDKGNRNDLYTLYEKRLKRAKIIDAFDESVKPSPAGRLVRARLSGMDRKGGGL
jgi:hypothetical protein